MLDLTWYVLGTEDHLEACILSVCLCVCVCVCVLPYVLRRETCFVSCSAWGLITWLRDDIIISSALNYIHMSLSLSLSLSRCLLFPHPTFMLSGRNCSFAVAIFTFLLPSSISSASLCFPMVLLKSNLLYVLSGAGSDDGLYSHYPHW